MMRCLKNSKLEKFQRVLVVIAHPDDESMFFSPIIISLIKTSSRIYLLCLSNGNAEGLGELRREELLHASSILGIQMNDIYLVNHPKLIDGMNTIWPVDVVSDIVLDLTVQLNPELVITFDDYGVSGHPNHIATSKGVVKALSISNSSGNSISCLRLESTNCFRKYLGIFDFLNSFLFFKRDIVVSNSNIQKTFLAMSAHASQYVWYRRIFLIISRYTYMNTLSYVQFT